MRANPYSEHLKLARNQRRKLERIAEKLTDLSIEWDGLDGGMESDLVDLADRIYDRLSAYRDVTESWRKGYAA